MIDQQADFQHHVKHWQHCRACKIGTWAYKHCFGQGNIKATHMFIGEGPGVSEDALGIPFVGPAGRLLQKGLVLAGFEPAEWFLTNLVACRPTDRLGGSNRAPNAHEVSNCASRLEGIVRIVRPKHIIAVGSVPAGYLLGRVGQFGGLSALYHKIKHPAWVLRQGGERSEAWSDFVEILKKLRRVK